MKLRILFVVLSFVFFSFTPGSFADEVFKSKGVVKKVDVKAGKASLDMDAVPSLKWPEMTMEFDVTDKPALERLAAGQKVDFDFIEKPKGHWVITKITAAK